MTWGNLPWLIMGAGILFGDVPSVVDYFNPRSSNPFIAGFFLSFGFLWVVGTYWLFARGGAEQLVRHPGLFQPISSPSAIKILWLLCLAAGVAGVSALYLRNLSPLGF
jgi:hypothetical protein